MALYPKNPENNVVEKYLFWAVKTVGVGGIAAGIYGLYVHIPIAISMQAISGWSILNITKSIVTVILGIGFLVYYKKSLSLFSSCWIIIPAVIFFTTAFFKRFIYHEPTIGIIISEVIYVSGILLFIICWFFCRKKYPEEFGLKS